MPLGILNREPYQPVETDPWQQAFTFDFSGGLVTSKPPLSLADNQFPELSNLFG